MRIIRWLKYRLSARSRKREALREHNARIVDARLSALLAHRTPAEKNDPSRQAAAPITDRQTAPLVEAES